jgi:hypothetical protein
MGIGPNPRPRVLKCPHCRVTVHPRQAIKDLGADVDGEWSAETLICTSCDRMTIDITRAKHSVGLSSGGLLPVPPPLMTLTVWPKTHGRDPLPPEAGDYAKDYDEACRVLPESPKASAALTRRCLQKLLKKEAKTKAKDLVDQIEEVLKSGTLPGEISGLLDAIRKFGNLAAHHDDRITDVEDHEAELCLDVLEQAIDFYAVQPAIRKAKIAAVNSKFTAAGMPPLQSPPQQPPKI